MNWKTINILPPIGILSHHYELLNALLSNMINLSLLAGHSQDLCTRHISAKVKNALPVKSRAMLSDK